MSVLRGDSVMGPAAAELTPEDSLRLASAQHPAMHAAQQMTACVAEAAVSDIIRSSLEQNIQLLVGYIGGCERIRKTPLPFAYVVHLRRSLVIYCLTLPFALVDTFGWFTVVDILLVAYTFFGIEEIGVEIEGPFGNDENDLPMQDICETIHANVYALSGMSQPGRETLPKGL
jgi:putative membrane protein